ncbi:MAG TPA: mannonate dehydratase [Bryobacteraceae bacterium]|jgi:mannonate dehydratase|nr:mannonate dehydratase [Bryobacteraceae bacterium]
MEQTWRWFGPQDAVSLIDARQAGATGIVTALHHIPPGQPWATEDIQRRKGAIENAGLSWPVVESVNVSEDIKRRAGNWQAHTGAYCETIRNLAACGIHTICYNFMPVLDWLRTDLDWRLPDGSLSMRFDAVAAAAFDLFILKRPDAAADWDESYQSRAHELFQAMSAPERERLTAVLLAALPGTRGVHSLDSVRESIAAYGEIGAEGLRANLGEFLRAVCPVAQEAGVRLAIHPDDPPRSFFGLPRIVSTAGDFEFLLNQAAEPANGITFCSGSLGVRPDNDLTAMARRFAERIFFVHLRSIRREEGADAFHEAGHLDGDADMVSLVKEFVLEERRRRLDDPGVSIPFRPDHGNKILTDAARASVPGYPAVGRLRGLAELRGILRAVEALV